MTLSHVGQVAAICLVAAAVTPARSDPLPGEGLKFQQRPMIITETGGGLVAGGFDWYGHDEVSTAYHDPNVPPETLAYDGRFMADDFADKYDTPVVHLRWWGSYLGKQHYFGDGVKRFYIGFESDVPNTDPFGGFSHPGAPLLEQWVAKGQLAPGSGTFTEKLIRGPDPVLGESLYEYNAELKCPFPEQHDTVYWLKIVALVDPQQDGPIQWGWHNRDWTVPDPLASAPPAIAPGEGIVGMVPADTTFARLIPVWHFQDDAVQGSVVTLFTNQCQANTDQFAMAPKVYVVGQDGPTGIEQFSKDLAFELYTIPEPATVVFAFGAIAAARYWRRRRV